MSLSVALAREHGVRLAGAGAAPLPVEVDGMEMTRVLSNLLVNAIRHTPADGTVAIAAERRADAVVLSVTDACGGIPEEGLPRAFDTGWRGSQAVPLPRVRARAWRSSEAHSGRADVHNVPGGCRFELTLPASA
ncbi:sensor histidine kinase [Streptomyces sp. NPDC051555]|uniref:sensor histidine kinase n=1 Tax=Streptomyces sp. NPDC051555 TaxID=3365657 RepID=UPI00378C2370